MAKAKSPAFQFYPKDWLASASVSLMTPAEEGAYIRLLAISWMEEDCGLPDDDAALSMLSRLGRQWYGKSGERIRDKFAAVNGRLYNERLLEERQKQLEWKEKSSTGGKKSATKRATKPQPNGKGGSPLVEECLQPKSNIAFPSSFASASTNIEQIPRVSDFPLVDDAIRRRCPTADLPIVVRITEAAIREYLSVDAPKIPPPDDSVIAAAVEEAARQSPKQTGPGLFLKTVPSVIRSWAQVGRPATNEEKRVDPVLEAAKRDGELRRREMQGVYR